MKHVSEGNLRRFADEPFALSVGERNHIPSCSVCAESLANIQSDQAFARAMLAVDGSAPNVAVARQQVMARSRSRGSLIPRVRMSRQGLLPKVTSLAVPALLITGLATGTLQSILTVFQPARVVPIAVTRGDLTGLMHLRHLGTLSAPPHHTGQRSATTLAAAGRESGLNLLAAGYLPAGTSSRRFFQVLPAESASFTFNASRASQYAARRHLALPAMPARINGTRVTLQTHAAVLTVYGPSSGIPDLVIGQTPAPTVTVLGAGLKTIESYVAAVPGMPRHLMSQLEAISKPTSALPIPVPVNWAYAQRVTVDGSPGLAVGDNTGVFSAVIWERAGVVYGVAGEITANEAIKTADSLH